MGHLFRSLNFSEYLNIKGERYFFLINNHLPSINILRERNVSFQVVDMNDLESDWETDIISEKSVSVWINDRLATDIRHAENVKKNNVLLVTFDDNGTGARCHDIHFAGLALERNFRPQGGKVFTGPEYLILSPEIQKHRRVRTASDSMLVSLGGSDTYNVTAKVVKILKQLGYAATIHIGPSYEHRDSLEPLIDENYKIVERVPSLVQLFFSFDLAVTGGGLTPFEANASGLPCVIVANEIFEIANGEFLHTNGSSVFACYHEQLSEEIVSDAISFLASDIESMSRRGINTIPTNAVERIYKQIQNA